METVPNRGKRISLWICLLGGLLFLCLACLELPEMHSLRDDTSNDFTILATTTSVASVVAVAVRISDTQTDLPAANPVLAPLKWISVSVLPGESAPRDLLILHSFWRT